MNFSLVFLSLYLLVAFITYAIALVIGLKDVDKFNAILISLQNKNPDLPDLEPKKTKLALAFFLFIMALAWPIRFLFFKSKQKEEFDSD